MGLMLLVASAVHTRKPSLRLLHELGLEESLHNEMKLG